MNISSKNTNSHIVIISPIITVVKAAAIVIEGILTIVVIEQVILSPGTARLERGSGSGGR